jgi:class 3 adenylate cyclase/DNA-binding winged helix-turn-helix (wHTH) protein/predicted ATPase
MASSQWCFADFRLDLDNACLWRGAQPVALTPKAFDVLQYLVTHPDRLVTKDTLLDAVWPETAISDAVVRIAIGELRRALGDTAQAPRFIATVHRRGYRFLAPVTEYPEVVPDPARTVLPTMPPLDAPAMPHWPPVAPPLAALLAPEAERRHLTVLFCDLVDSTRLAGHLDPEDLREVVHAYHQACAAVIQRYDGYIAQYLGDGLLVYFGYPMAHEDDAQRAVRAGLGILHALDSCNAQLMLPPGEQLAVRLGAHTGLVVVGPVGDGARQEPLALGETPHLAARLQELAVPNTLVVSVATWQLLGGFFAGQALDPQRLRGETQPLEVYQVLAETTARSRLDAARRMGLTPLVGREQEIGLLQERWAQVKDGFGQVVLLSGEAGIGKSRLIEVLQEQVASEPQMWLALCQCSPYYQHTALYPWIELLERRVLSFEREESPAQKLCKLKGLVVQYGLLQAEAVPLLAALLSIPLTAEYAPLPLSPEQQKQHTLHTLLTILLCIAAQQPVLFIMEDLHWVDPTTLDLLSLLIDQGPTARILTLLTSRLDFTPPWTGRAHCTQVTLARLPQPQVTEIARRVAHGKALPAEVGAQIVAKADGVPLFVEEVTRMVLESGLLQEQDDHYVLTAPLPPLAIPATLHDSLLARLDHLGSVKGLAQLGATLGRDFAYALLRAVSPWDEETLQRGLHQLIAMELLYQQGLPPQATYLFKHALIQEAAYQSLLYSTRRQYHQQIAQVLEAQFPDTVATQPELLAHHYTAADCMEPAVGYWQRAGERALRQSAHLEAERHLTTALELLATLPETPVRTQQELALQTALGSALAALHGFGAPAVERPYARARALCRQLGETPQLFPVLIGLRSFYNLRGELKTARELGEQLLHVAQHAQEPGLLLEAHFALGVTLFFSGAFAEAGTHLEDGLALYEPKQPHRQVARYGIDPGVGCGSYLALTLWHRGYPDRARRQSAATLALAHELAHPFSQGAALCFAAMLQQYCRDVATVRTHAAAALTLCQTYGFAQFLAQMQVIHGWAVAAQGEADAGLAQMHQGLAAQRVAGAELSQPHCLGLLAETYGRYGQPEAGLTALVEGLAMTRKFGECWCEAELHRLHGALLMQVGERWAASECSASLATSGVSPGEEVEANVHRAWSIARRQEAKSLELRAATSLARLWQQGKRAAARDLLAPIYGWFTEGFDTADHQDAKVLLEVLGG